MACCSVSFASTRSSIARSAVGRSDAPINRTASSRAEPVIARGLCPHLVAGPIVWSAPWPAGSRARGCAARRVRVPGRSGHGSAPPRGRPRGERPENASHSSRGTPGDLEVPAILAGALLDRVSLSYELVGERGAVERAHLPRGAEDRPRGDRHDPVVLTDSACDHDMAVQLRVRRLRRPSTPRAVVCRYSVAITSLACSSTTWPLIATAHDRHLLSQVRGSSARPPRRGPARSARAATDRRAPTPPRRTSAR